jgi:two-component system CheB/CheR fusion protein
MGFHIMQYRARIINASLEINGSPGEGTVVTCKFRGTNVQH